MTLTDTLTQDSCGRCHVWTPERADIVATFPDPESALRAIKAAEALVADFFNAKQESGNE